MRAAGSLLLLTIATTGLLFASALPASALEPKASAPAAKSSVSVPKASASAPKARASVPNCSVFKVAPFPCAQGQTQTCTKSAACMGPSGLTNFCLASDCTWNAKPQDKFLKKNPCPNGKLGADGKCWA
jgi:hypothetical protein